MQIGGSAIGRDSPDLSHEACLTSPSFEPFDPIIGIHVATADKGKQFDAGQTDAFVRIIKTLKEKISDKIKGLPDISIFYAKGWRAAAFWDGRHIYVNLAAFESGTYPHESDWFKIILHEVAHMLLAEHNAQFADLVQDLMALFIPTVGEVAEAAPVAALA